MSGGSSVAFDGLVVELLKLIQPRRVLDIGPGQGKYASLLQRAGILAHKVAIEIDAGYAEKFDLKGKYDEVRIADACELLYRPEAHHELFDCVIIGDCIEHLPKSKGLDLLNFLNYRCGWMIVVAPEFAYYDTTALAHTESHISCWSEFDFQWHDRFAYMRSEVMQIFLLRGYQPSPTSMEKVVGTINTNPPRVAKTGGEDLKPAHLELFSRPRIEIVDGNAFTYRHP